MPNAGKSTLLSRISAARPEIANYPFTTKHPNIGIVQATPDTSFAVADIPGLIEGASDGIGLGHEFLRHVERAGLLIHLVEPLPSDGSDPVLNYKTIREELRQYSPELAKRNEIVVVSKCELPGAQEVRDALAEAVGQEVRMISAVTGQGLAPLVQQIAEAVAEQARQAAANRDAGNLPAASGTVAPAGNQAPKPRRLPPHLSGPTAQLSDELQPRDFGEASP